MISSLLFLSDMPFIFQWWGVFFLLGILFFPFTASFFPLFIDKAYPFAKILGLTVFSYIVFFLGTLHLIPFQSHLLYVLLFVIAILSILQWRTFLPTLTEKNVLPLIIIEEFFFLVCLLFWSYIRGSAPDIHGLEKFMDFGFLNAILRTDYFPPNDMWFTPHAINYYYFGHLMTAIMTKLSFVAPPIAYNLMIAALFAYCFSLSFSIGINITHASSLLMHLKKRKRILFLIGLFCALFTTLGGNLHTLYAFLTPYTNGDPTIPTALKFALHTFPNNYWYPNATRFIFNTIHEFPLYSFVVSDLHGHVLDIPIVLTLIAIVFHLFLMKKIALLDMGLVGFLLAIAYMTNVSDSVIYFILTALVVFTINVEKISIPKHAIGKTAKTLAFILITFVLFSLPFSFFFKPFTSGIGILCAPSFLTAIGHIGPFLFEEAHCQHSPVWQLIILYGFFYFWVVSFIVYLFHTKKIERVDIFILLLIGTSTLLLLIPEFVYIKDIYPAHYRANTMFKFAYQAFIMLSLTSSYIFIKMLIVTKKLFTSIRELFLFFAFIFIGLFLILLVGIYPYFAITSYYGNLSYKGLDGMKYLSSLYPDDYAGIRWLMENVQKQPVILEAQGDSYTDYARVSANTGLPTVLGWTVHEWLWRGTYDIPAPRIEEIKKLYESTDTKEVKSLLQKYTINYVFIGTLERQKYPSLNETLFRSVGTAVFQKGETTIYKITLSSL